MTTKWIETHMLYDGSQLRSLFAYLNFEILGDSIVSWRGPCNVDFEKMVDGEDLLARAKIEGSDMVHFIVEKFDCDLYAGVGFQRLLSSLAIDVLKNLTPLASALLRKGDDIYLENKKLSISIATKSPTSVMIHFAVNISNVGTPVSTVSLEELKVEPKAFAQALMAAFSSEVKDMVIATRKVRWVQ